MKNVGRSKNTEKGRVSSFGRRKKQERFEASYAQRDCSRDCSSSDSESSQYYLGTEFQGEERESCNDPCEAESRSNSCGAQWDVFQKQDVSKLLEYIKNHSLELEPMDSSKKQVSFGLMF